MFIRTRAGHVGVSPFPWPPVMVRVVPVETVSYRSDQSIYIYRVARYFEAATFALPELLVKVPLNGNRIVALGRIPSGISGIVFKFPVTIATGASATRTGDCPLRTPCGWFSAPR